MLASLSVVLVLSASTPADAPVGLHAEFRADAGRHHTLVAQAPASTAIPTPPVKAPKSAAKPAAGAQGIDYTRRVKKGRFSFEFSKAEIIDIVKAISDMTRKNFIIPEKLKSQRLTILSPTKINASEAWQVFLSALAANGITIVRNGKFYRLVESKSAIKTTIPTCIGPEDICPKYSDQMVTVIIHLQYIEGSQINPVLKSLTSKEGELTLFAPTNALIVSEYAPNLARIKRIIQALDQPGFDDELKLVQIEHATASEIADKLTQVFEVQQKGRPGAGSSGRKRPGDKKRGSDDQDDVQISKIIADDRTNKLIIKANRRSFDAIKKLIEQLDIPTEDIGRVHVVHLENASAEDLASTLSSLAQGTQQSGRKTPSRGGSKGGKAGADSAALFQGEVKVSADKSTNSLLIIASRNDFLEMRRLIEKLDIARRQVYVEAAILEVTVTDNDEFGLNWHAPLRFSKDDIGGDAGGGGTFGYVQSAQQSGGISPTLLSLSDPAALLGVAGGSVIGVVGKGVDIPIGDDTLTIPSFGVILRWLESSSNANILSTPHILTTDNEEASIEVGQKIPFQRGTALPSLGGLGGLGGAGRGGTGGLGGLGGLGNLFASTDRIDVSLKLTIKPQINERDKVRLELDQQIEDLVGKEETTGQPITANRSAKTVVVVDDQQTVVIGGLMRDRVRKSESKIPILGDLPILGWFFKQRSSEIEKVNLLLVLTPYIISDPADFQEIFERKIQEHEEFAAEYYGHKAEYRAHIDYRRKNGPFALMARTVLKEMKRRENGGDGDGDLLITPSKEPPPAVAPPQKGPTPDIEMVPEGGVEKGPTGGEAATTQPPVSTPKNESESESVAVPVGP